MSDVTKIINNLYEGDSSQAAKLLPLIYEELRRLASQKFNREKPGHTLQPTVLVHEAYLRLVDVKQPQRWNGRGHFFAAAAEAMRRILIEHARARKYVRRGGGRDRIDIQDVELASNGPNIDILALDEALSEMEQRWPEKAHLVQLRYFAGMTIAEASEAMAISHATAERHWKFARSWLFAELNCPPDAEA